MVRSRSEFPRYDDGDVLIIINTTQIYKLHSQVLRNRSSFFADQLDRHPPPRLIPQARRNNAASSRFEWQPSHDDSAIGHFKRIDLNDSGRPRRPNTSNSLALVPEFEAGKPNRNANKAWEWMFGVLYNLTPQLDDSSLTSVLSDVMALIECAEAIGSMDHVCNIVDLALLRQDTVLWTSILGNPAVWVELGARVRSPSIFSEAAIHLIGQWHSLTDADKLHIREEIRAVIERKARDLGLRKEAIELRILGHYPVFLARRAADKPGRPSYSHDIYMWQCVAFFRQWFAQNISDDRTRRAPDGGLAFYCRLADGGQAYLSHLDFQDFHRHFPMSIKACHVLETNMGLLKDDVKRFVAPLVAQNTHLKREEYAIGWLTCASLAKDDLPWYSPEPEPKDLLTQMYEDMDQENLLAQEDGSGMAKRTRRAARMREDIPPPESSALAEGLGIFQEAADDGDDEDEDENDATFLPLKQGTKRKRAETEQEGEDEIETVKAARRRGLSSVGDGGDDEDGDANGHDHYENPFEAHDRDEVLDVAEADFNGEILNDEV